jgi:prepilin-type N-terminal cleavage/methylation domain-containing protein
MYKMKIPKYKAGFTVLESIVAISILSLSISGAFSAVQQSLSQSIMSKDEVKAFYLAQEAVEAIRNKRDTNYLNIVNSGGGSWLAGITDLANCPFDKVCMVDAYPNPPTFTLCGNEWGSCPVMKQDLNSSFMYNYALGSDTNFKREIQIEQVPGNPDEIAIIVKISWSKGIINREFKIKTFLSNWL